jgi:hypothetical protein
MKQAIAALTALQSHMMDLAYEGTTYSAWRRGIPGGRNEYKSITITPNATAEEFMDFYLDDPSRPKWDNMISGALGWGGPAMLSCGSQRLVGCTLYVLMVLRRPAVLPPACWGAAEQTVAPFSHCPWQLAVCGRFHSWWFAPRPPALLLNLAGWKR